MTNGKGTIKILAMNGAFFAFLAVILVAIAVIASITVRSLIALNRRVERYEQSFLKYMTAESEGKPSGFALLTEAIATQFAQKLLNVFKTSALGQNSGEVRLESAVAKDMIQDAVGAQNPLFGLLMSAFPTVTKRLAKNPAALPAVLEVLGKLGKGGGLAGITGSSGNGQGWNPDKYK